LGVSRLWWGVGFEVGRMGGASARRGARTFLALRRPHALQRVILHRHFGDWVVPHIKQWPWITPRSQRPPAFGGTVAGWGAMVGAAGGVAEGVLLHWALPWASRCRQAAAVSAWQDGVACG